MRHYTEATGRFRDPPRGTTPGGAASPAVGNSHGRNSQPTFQLPPRTSTSASDDENDDDDDKRRGDDADDFKLPQLKRRDVAEPEDAPGMRSGMGRGREPGDDADVVASSPAIDRQTPIDSPAGDSSNNADEAPPKVHDEDEKVVKTEEASEVGRCKLDPSLKATWFQHLNLRFHSVLST